MAKAKACGPSGYLRRQPLHSARAGCLSAVDRSPSVGNTDPQPSLNFGIAALGNAREISSKRNRNKKAWARARRAKARAENKKPPIGPQNADPTRRRPHLRARGTPSELDQVGVLIVEEQLDRASTSLDGLRRIAATLPFEPSMVILAMLAGRVEAAAADPGGQLAVAEWLFGPGAIVDRFRAIIALEPRSVIFGPQPLYTLIRIVIEEAREASILEPMSTGERDALSDAIIAANSVTQRGIARGGSHREELLAFELQVGNYHSRPTWMEEIVRPRELYRLATEDPELLTSPDHVPLEQWTLRSGLSAEEQSALGFALGAVANAWDPEDHPHVRGEVLDDLLSRAGLGGERREPALSGLAATRAEFRAEFSDLGAGGERLIWELRPFNSRPFLRLSDEEGLLLLGRPWMLNWLGEGFHYRMMRVAQAQDASRAAGRGDHVQRYTAYAGQVFESYCLSLAGGAVAPPAVVLGEQRYGKGGGKKTSDVAVFDGQSLVLFEVNARRVGAEPLLSGDPLDVTNEFKKLLVKKIDQLGVAVGALLDGSANLPGVEIDEVVRIIPVVVSAGRLWQTGTLWEYLDRSRDAEKCRSFEDGRVAPLQALDPGEYEALLAYVDRGESMAGLLGRKADGPYRHRDLAAWLEGDRPVADINVRLPAIEASFEAMMAELAPLFGIDMEREG
ncbi:MAG: hypothetical protein JST59_22335 [Actinobacteria bacterium]|nr:hypothetical protein [Actinomycetota bacterium]